MERLEKPPNVNYMNPIYKQKSVTEFIDITRNGASNPGYEFRQLYKEHPDCFKKRNEICSDFGDSHLTYKGMCLRPFVDEHKAVSNPYQ